jgi:hypothetical protein
MAGLDPAIPIMKMQSDFHVFPTLTRGVTSQRKLDRI